MIQWFIRATCPRVARSPVPLPDGVSVRQAAWVPAVAGRMLGMNRPAVAVTLERTIVFHPSAEINVRIMRHELAHVRQWEQHPFTFFLRYALQNLRYGYDNNPYEVEARAAELSDRED